MRKPKKPFRPVLSKLTASLIGVAIVTAGAVSVFAPEEGSKAFIALLTFVAGALLKGLFHGGQSDPEDSDEPTDPSDPS